MNLLDAIMGNNLASLKLNRKKINFISSFGVKNKRVLNRRRKLLRGYYVLLTERRLFDNYSVFQIYPYPSDPLAFHVPH